MQQMLVKDINHVPRVRAFSVSGDQTRNSSGRSIGRNQKPEVETLVRIVRMRLSSVMVSAQAVSNAGSPSEFSQRAG